MFRTIHHQAATGGTLISKCLASMHKVRLLSEVNPLGPFTGPIHFEPTNILSQYVKQYGRPGKELLYRHFAEQLKIINEMLSNSNISLIMRDHNHNEYMSAVEKVDRKPLLKSIEFYCKHFQTECPIKSIVTVRHPIDSFMGCYKKGWTKKISNDVETYASRYLTFLDDFSDLSIFKYESFCEDPSLVMNEMCDELDINFDSTFIEKFSDIRLTGDSGRTSNKIEIRRRRDVPNEIMIEMKNSKGFKSLCEKLNYDFNA